VRHRLDRDRPFGTVYGLLGVAYAQDGHYFDAGGVEVDDPESPVGQMAGRPELLSAQPSPGAVLTATGEPAKISRFDRESHERKVNQALREQVEGFGEKWQGIEHARRFLGIA
jgi:hypothetical protein